MIISIPSKTFLMGEYVAMRGGPSLVINTTPRFTCTLTSHTEPSVIIDFASQGPAGALLNKLQPALKNYQLQFYDPHEQQGGFGASSAQYLALLALESFLLQSPFPSLPHLLRDYQAYFSDPKPSGADLIAQLTGQISYYAHGTAQACDWPFTDLGFTLVRTGFKVATHVHLAQLKDLDSTDLSRIASAIVAAFFQRDADKFILGIKNYADQLTRQGLVYPPSYALLQKIVQLPFVKAAKGCGAQGADVILIIHAVEDRHKLTQWAQEFALPLVATEQDLTDGLTL